MKTTILHIAATFAAAFALTGCFDLSEEVYSEIPMDDFLKNEQEVVATAGRAYRHLQAFGKEQGLYTLMLLSADECCAPKRDDGHWDDGGRYLRLHRHQWDPSDKLLREGWKACFNTIATCNDILYEMSLSDMVFAAKTHLEAEVKILRAFMYFLAIDCWDQIPFSIDYTDTSYPEPKSREFVFKFIEQEILDNIDLMEEVPTTGSYGRMTKGGAYALLAKLYLNAEVLIGKPMWEKAEQACKQVIDSGHYIIEPKFEANFVPQNEGSRENIFVIPYDTANTSGSSDYTFMIYILTLPDSQWTKDTFNIPYANWDGFVCQPDFFQRYSPQDKRRDLTFIHSESTLFPGAPFNAVFDEALFDGAGRAKGDDAAGINADGARLCKYQFQDDGRLSSSSITMDNDFVLIRYADVVMMWVEALMRQGRVAEAITHPDFQAIRIRAGLEPYTQAELTLDELLDERGREFAWELWRRNDLIRFGKFCDPWWAKPERSAPRSTIYPIPTEILNANPKLSQLDAYLEN